MAHKRSFRNFIKWLRLYIAEVDVVLLATSVAICVFGIINLYGITGPDYAVVQKQTMLLFVGIILMIVFSFFNFRYLKNYSMPVLVLYMVSIVFLFMALSSQAVRGINAWIVVGGFMFEPSELAKLAVIILLAKYFSQRHMHINQFRHIIVSGIYVGIPTLVVLMQPDIGSAAILVLIWFGMLFAAGMNRRHLFLIASAAIFFVYLSFIYLLQPYQKERILAFMNPYRDPTGIGYNIIQSKIAIGSGGWIGNGFGNGSQATLGFLPEPLNDFVFSSLAEQFGFIGIAFLFGLFAVFLFRMLAIGERTDNNFGKLFSIGLTIFVFSHVAISAAVNIGLMPITGIPFTFLSFGGSHLISVMVGLGVLQSIRRYG
jgi:rod shape determining protein RodA